MVMPPTKERARKRCGTTSGEPSRRSFQIWLAANRTKTASEAAIETNAHCGQSSWRPSISGNISMSMATRISPTPIPSTWSGCGDLRTGR